MNPFYGIIMEYLDNYKDILRCCINIGTCSYQYVKRLEFKCSYDIDFITSCSNVELLSIMDSSIDFLDLKLISEKCKKIKILNLHGSRNLRRLPPSLKNLTNLICLDMCWTSLDRSSLQYVGEIKSLVFLFMCHCSLTDISFMYNLVNLESINIRNNRVCLTSGIRRLDKLYNLDISYNPTIRDISCLEFMNLTKLYVSGTSIRNMEIIQSLPKLNLLGFRDIILNSRESIINVFK